VIRYAPLCPEAAGCCARNLSSRREWEAGESDDLSTILTSHNTISLNGLSDTRITSSVPVYHISELQFVAVHHNDKTDLIPPLKEMTVIKNSRLKMESVLEMMCFEGHLQECPTKCICDKLQWINGTTELIQLTSYISHTFQALIIRNDKSIQN
jgi:hypothetical protein